MMEIVNIIKDLKATTSSKSKQLILEAHKDNELLKKIIKYTYNDSKYGITKEIISPYILEFATYEGDVFELLDKLATSNINDDLRKEVGLMLGSLSQEEGELVLNIMTKDLRCGISTKTVQKIWKDLIPKWEVQQAYPIDKVKLKKNEWIAISQKLNGSRGSFLNGEIKSRQNKRFDGLDHIIDDIKALELDDWFIDGELIRDNYDNKEDNENFRLSLSILASDNIDKSEIKFKIYDIVPKEEFLAGESKLKYPQRIEQLAKIKNKIKCLKLKHVDVLDILYQGTDHTETQKWLEYADKSNWEGCMLYRDSVYKCKRHNGILKVKSFKHCDVTCKTVYEGEGKYAGALGGIIVNYKGFETGVGSGFSDSERMEFWNNPKTIVGKIVQIKYKEESKNKQGGLSMQFATFECVRNDKVEESYN